jgi:hypothetical protein
MQWYISTHIEKQSQNTTLTKDPFIFFVFSMEILEDPKSKALESLEPLKNRRENLQKLKTEVVLPKIVSTADRLSKK